MLQHLFLPGAAPSQSWAGKEDVSGRLLRNNPKKNLLNPRPNLFLCIPVHSWLGICALHSLFAVVGYLWFHLGNIA